MKSFFFMLAIILTTTIFAQEPAGLSTTDYAKKSKNQKIAGWCLLGGGLITGTIGTIISLRESVKIAFVLVPIAPQVDEKKLNTGAALLVTGAVATLSSFPCFILSGKNKRKAAAIALKNESVHVFQKNAFANSVVPAVRLTIRF